MRIILSVVMCAMITGCNAMRVGGEPSKVTLQTALQSVEEGINDMYVVKKERSVPNTGLLPSEVEVTFNVSFDATDTSKVYVEAGANAADTLKIAKLGGEAGTSITAKRGNQITVKFTNILYAPKDTLAGAKTGEEISRVLDASFGTARGPIVPLGQPTVSATTH